MSTHTSAHMSLYTQYAGIQVSLRGLNKLAERLASATAAAVGATHARTCTRTCMDACGTQDVSTDDAERFETELEQKLASLPDVCPAHARAHTCVYTPTY